MVDKAWKAQERIVAKALGSHRNPNNGTKQADITTTDGKWAVEHKKRIALPNWLWDALDQAIAAAESGEGERPLVILTQSRRGVKAKRLAVMRFEDFLEVLQ